MPEQGFAGALGGLTTPADRLCVGVDPHPHLLADWGLPDSALGVTRFTDAVVEAVLSSGIRIIKPQVAFFERHGVAGMQALSNLIGSARNSGLVVIADAKRGDVGSTVAAYAEAWLAPGGDFESDAMTAVAYQGVGSIEPMCEAALSAGKGLFVLANTSNPDGWQIQKAHVDSDTTVAQQIVNDLVDRQHTSGHTGWLGCVVGTTLSPPDRAVTLTSDLPLWVLAPGFGFQGANLSDLETLFPGVSHRVIPTVSRSVVADGPDGIEQAISRHLQELAP